MFEKIMHIIMYSKKDGFSFKKPNFISPEDTILRWYKKKFKNCLWVYLRIPNNNLNNCIIKGKMEVWLVNQPV